MVTKLLRASTRKIFHFSISDFIKVKINYLREYEMKTADKHVIALAPANCLLLQGSLDAINAWKYAHYHLSVISASHLQCQNIRRALLCESVHLTPEKVKTLQMEVAASGSTKWIIGNWRIFVQPNNNDDKESAGNIFQVVSHVFIDLSDEHVHFSFQSVHAKHMTIATDQMPNHRYSETDCR